MKVWWEQRNLNGHLYATQERALSSFLLALECEGLEVVCVEKMEVHKQANLFTNVDDFTIGAWVRKRMK